jgi:signal transduction histidine kinase
MTLSSLTNRIFLASALLAVMSIAVAIYNVNVAVTAEAERELARGLDEAGELVEEYRRLLSEHFGREARLAADLPRFKAVVELNDPPTVQPLAVEYQQQLAAQLVLVTSRTGRVLAQVEAEPYGPRLHELPSLREAAAGHQATSFWPHPGGILQVVSVPILIDPHQPEILGTLSIGFSLDNEAAAVFRALTNSEVAFGVNGAIQASTLSAELWPALNGLLARDGLTPTLQLGADEYIALTRTLAAPARGVSRGSPAAVTPGPTAILLRSRTERLRFLTSLHRSLGITALVAVLAATLLSYAIARTVTRPLGAITATMREMAATGDLTRRIALPSARWEDEDARVLATTFNRMTDSIDRFQREAAQRARLSSLGRLSTVVAHEIRNPLMIIKASLRTLRRDQIPPSELHAAVTDIDEEVARLNRIVSEVLDFARPIRFELAPADLNALCRDAARAVAGEGATSGVQLQTDPALPPIVTDAERLRLALVNILTNAQHAVAARKEPGPPPHDAIRLTTALAGNRARLEVSDRGVGIPPEDLARVFDPYFTTRRTGTGLGLAISRNIIEGLGGTIAVSSRAGYGTDVRIELPV